MGEVVPGRFPSLTGGESVDKVLNGEESGGFGLDRLSVSFPLYRAPDSPLLSATVPAVLPGREEPGPASFRGLVPVVEGEDERGRKVTKVGVFVSAAYVGGEWWGKAECNPSRVWDPDGCSLVPVDSVHAAAELMWGYAREVLAPKVDSEDCNVTRVDVARDFRGIRNVGMYVRGLLNVKRPYAKRAFIYADARRHNAETLAVGSGAGTVRLYDQHSAYADKGAPEGSLRWEVEARGDWIGKGARASKVGRLDGGRLRTLAEQRWEWSGMWRGVRATVDVVEAIDRMTCRHRGEGRGGRKSCGCGGLSQAKADRLLGQLVRESLSVAGRQSKDTAADYEKLKRTLGIVPSAELFAGAVCFDVSGRLDWELGTEVAA